jgi:hypothetical protein
MKMCPHEKLLYDPMVMAEELLPGDTAKMSIKPEGVTTNGHPAGSTNGTATSHTVTATNGDKAVTDLPNDPASSSSPSPVLTPAPSSGATRETEPPPFLIIKKKLWEQINDKYGFSISPHSLLSPLSTLARPIEVISNVEFWRKDIF